MRKALFVLLVAGILLISARAYAVTGTEFQFWADEATYINREMGYSTNYGSAEYLRVRDASTPNSTPPYPNLFSRTLLKFTDSDLAQLSGLTILSASLHLYEYERTASSTSDEVNLRRATSDWDEDDVTWETRPTFAARTAYRLFDSTDTTPGWRSWQGSLADIVGWWVTGAESNYGLMLENDWDGEIKEINSKFYSDDYTYTGDTSFHPYLRITATPEPVSSILLVLGAGCLGTFIGFKRKKIAKAKS